MRNLVTKGLAVLLVMLSSVILFACNPPPATIEINQNEKYYIKELRTDAFYYSGTKTVINRAKDLSKKDPSYCIFEDDFNRFRIGFYQWTVEQDAVGGIAREGWLTPPYMTEFIATNVKRGDGNLTADLSGVVDGRVVHYNLYTDAGRLIIRADVTYKLKADTGEHTVTRNTIVASFSRVAPAYINGGGGS